MIKFDRPYVKTNRRFAYVTVIAFAILSTAFSHDVQAVGLSIARSAGMAGAYMGLARGNEAAYYNPANLGLESHQQTGLSLAGVGVNISNNAFTLGDYNQYNGSFLTQSDKDDILNKIPVDGLILSAEAEASAGGFSSGSYALTFTGWGGSELNLGHDVLDLLLNGNQFGDTIRLDDMYGSAWSYASVGLSAGKSLYTKGTRKLSAGATFHFIRGFYFADVTRLEGSFATLTTGFQGDGSIVAQTAEGGSGYSVDIGLALQINPTYTAGLTVRNLISSITWNKNPEERGYIFQFDTLNINNSNDSVVISNDYTIPLTEFSSKLPVVARWGIADTRGKFLWAFDWEQGFNIAPGSSTRPRLSLGAEYKLIKHLPLRSGFALGGQRGKQLAFGTGLAFPKLHVDLAVVSGGFNSNQSKGGQVALSAGLNF